MISTDITSPRNRSHSLEVYHNLSSNNEVHSKNKYHHHNEHIEKPLHMSFLDLLHWYQTFDTLENKNTEQQQQQQQQQKQQQEQESPTPRRPSIIKPTDIPRAISKKSVTFASFASVFNLPDNEYEKDPTDFRRSININNKTIIEKDSVIVIRNNQIDDEVTIDSNENIEPDVIRPNVSFSPSPQSNMPINIITNSHHSRKSIIHHFIQHRHQKKRRHTIKTINPVIPLNRTNSAPHILFSTSTTLTPATTIRTNNSEQQQQQQPTKNVGTWFKSSSIGRFVKSFGRHSRQNQKVTNSKTRRIKSHRSSTIERLSEIIF
ncbi:unnamed protein product [Adineta steineri]|uniref:Uncharacterized protein n=1 Tax=Adineta steineri TaxID=433720 RepID=A0A815J2G0_9BILA|nr:unnamed protein product [Adineta steineri]CAF3536493.1 unnamed protein product [Adineta steineri]